jgi:class 3 adenylate cyclase
VVLGLYAAVLPPILAGAVTLWDSRFIGLYTASLASVGILPLAVLVSISRFNLFDVDRLLSTAAVWNVLLALGLALALLIVPMLAAAGSEVLGIRTPATQVLVLALFTAAAFATHGQIRSGVERVLFADRFRIDQGAKELHGQIAGCGDARELIACLGRSLDALLKPRSCGVYARDGDAFTPVFGTGRDHALFHASGPLAFTLAHGRKPVALGLSRRFAEPSLAPFDHAVLESLEAAVVVPVFDRGELRMVVCLGEKSSGDVYTPADVHLLSALGDHASTALQRFDQSELLAQMRAMEQELRGFVPRAVAEQLAGGRRLEQGQRELTVLFADIRGYSSLAESQHPEDTFSMLRAYAEMATEAVLRQDGRLVDFAGDGIMAVFGTGTERRAKESAAVHAALEILERAVEVPIQGTPDAGRALSICVGIATGTVFVGEIPSADHRIWAVVGTTTNRASRLQQLSRPLGASIAIDRPTWERTGDVTRAFELRAGVDVRGHREPVDVWLLPAARRTESPSGTPGTSGDAVASV